ncbi:MAG: DUF2490 domain-containing protein [Saprospiraceae bacterium]|nr:DUF2490 domain-containing protein [Saprospiraceae bacterium]
MEYRPYEDFILTEKFGNINLQHRLRFEQRFFKNVLDGVVQMETAFNHRFRYSINCNIPLSKKDTMYAISFKCRK